MRVAHLTEPNPATAPLTPLARSDGYVSAVGLESLMAGYRRPDRAADPEALISYLEAFGSLAEVRRMKRRSFDLLGLESSASVLDVGCGSGADVAELARRVGKLGRAAGLDPNRHAVEAARRSGLDCTVGRAEKLPFAPGSFDACRADRVLQYAERPQQAAGEMARVLRAGGRAVISEGWIHLDGAPDPDPEVLATVIVPVGTGGRSEGWMGQFVPLLLERAGFADIRVEEDEGRIKDVDEVLRTLSLSDVAQVRNPDRRKRWVARLQEDLAAERRWLVVGTMHVVGTRP
jgi:SAM-dependent methyltransferase